MSRRFRLSDELEEYRGALRRFADKELAPRARQADEDAVFPRESFEAFRDAGFLRPLYPEEYGGEGGDTLTYALTVEEVARACAASSLFVVISRLGVMPILRWGTQELAARYVPLVVEGASQFSYCLSETEAGSDVASMATRAEKTGDGWRLTGRKAWITNAGVSDRSTVFAKSDPEAGNGGISAFVVESDMAGFSIGKLEDKLGVRGSPTGEVILDGVEVPAENLIGEEGRGFSYALTALDGSRPIIGIQAVGIAQGALDVALDYVVERKQFGKRIADFQGIQFMLADMATKVDAARLLCYRACEMIDAGDPDVSRSAAMAKYFAADTAMEVTTDAVQLLGGAGYTKEFPVERMMRDAKITQIYEGTNQIQRMVVARRMLDAVVGERS